MHIQLFLPQFQNSIQKYDNCELVPLTTLPTIKEATCKFIHLGNCCDFVQTNEVIIEATKKLRYGGKLLIEGTDLIEVMYALFRNVLTLENVQQLLFMGRYSCSTLEQMENLLKQLGLKIVKKRLFQYRYSITAER